MRTFLTFSVALFAMGCGGGSSSAPKISGGVDIDLKPEWVKNPLIEKKKQQPQKEVLVKKEEGKQKEEDSLREFVKKKSAREAKNLALKRSLLPGGEASIAEDLWKKLNRNPAEDLTAEEYQFLYEYQNPRSVLFENLYEYRYRLAEQNGFQEFATNMKLEFDDQRRQRFWIQVDYGGLRKEDREKVLEISRKFKKANDSFSLLNEKEKRLVDLHRGLFGVD